MESTNQTNIYYLSKANKSETGKYKSIDYNIIIIKSFKNWWKSIF